MLIWDELLSRSRSVDRGRTERVRAGGEKADSRDSSRLSPVQVVVVSSSLDRAFACSSEKFWTGERGNSNIEEFSAEGPVGDPAGIVETTEKSEALEPNFD